MDANVNFDPREDAYSKPLDKIDVSDPRLYYDDIWRPYFERLRREDPVHFTPDSPYGPYWAVTKYRDIVQVEVNHKVFSSSDEVGGIMINDAPKGMERTSFIRMDPPEHDDQRREVSSTVNPITLAKMESLIRDRTNMVLDGLPRGETFNWVERVSIELTSMMLATLFDYPIEDKARLIRWSDTFICDINAPDAPVRVRGRALRRTDAVRRAHERDLGGTREEAEELRRDLDHGARRGDQPDDAAPAHGHPDPVPGRRQRHDAQLDVGRVAGAEPVPRSVPEAARESGADAERGVGDRALADAGDPYAAHRAGGCRDRRQADQGGRQGGDLVHLGQSRRGGDRATRTRSSSIASGRASICRSASASIAAWATAWPSCSCASCGRRSCGAICKSRWWTNRSTRYSNFLHAIRSLPVRIAA